MRKKGKSSNASEKERTRNLNGSKEKFSKERREAESKLTAAVKLGQRRRKRAEVESKSLTDKRFRAVLYRGSKGKYGKSWCSHARPPVEGERRESTGRREDMKGKATKRFR